MELQDKSDMELPDISRMGEQYRVNSDRFFNIMNAGWYAFTREGIGGPFDERSQAEHYVTELGVDRPEESWHHEPL